MHLDQIFMLLKTHASTQMCPGGVDRQQAGTMWSTSMHLDQIFMLLKTHASTQMCPGGVDRQQAESNIWVLPYAAESGLSSF